MEHDAASIQPGKLGVTSLLHRSRPGQALLGLRGTWRRQAGATALLGFECAGDVLYRCLLDFLGLSWCLYGCLTVVFVGLCFLNPRYAQ